ncbi:hypothetical protein PG991_003450 [Apiospora marii]|uniref:Rhodopsin domain-containing protein n=1 Tax=Apiospora marii TaxID=335849 RepID=A0ABR1S3J7_9PEZI
MDPGYLDNTPIVPPPPGRESNFVDPESRSYQLVIIIAVLSALVITFTSARIYTRLRITHSFGVDDWFCIAATGSLADSVLLQICITLIKVSFLLLYRRLFRPVTHIKAMVWTGISLVVTFCVAYIIIVIVACAPWPSEHDGWLDGRMAQRCNDIAVPLLTAAAYFSVLTDFYILAIPLHQVPQLRLSRKRKVGISFIFLTGLLAIGAGLTNLIFRQKRGILDFSDFSWTTVAVYATCMAEINVGLVALSMPVVLAQFVGRLTDIGRSLSSWIRARRTPPHSVVGSESASDLAPAEAGADHAAQRPPGGGQQQQLPPRPIPNPTLSGMRKFIRNLQLSRAAASASRGGSLSGHGGATIRDDNSNYLRTFDDLTSADFSYHIQLKAMRASESTLEVERGGDKAGGTHSTREDGK